MPKLTLPRSMIDLEGEGLSGEPMQANFEAMQALVDSGLDWENIEQWSLDPHHVGHANDDPNKGLRLKHVVSLRTGTSLDPLNFTIPGEWFSFSRLAGSVQPQVPSFHVESSAGIFFIGSVCATGGRDCRMEIRARIQQGGDTAPWTTIWYMRGPQLTQNSGPMGIAAAYKTGYLDALYRVDVQVRCVRPNAPMESTATDGLRPVWFSGGQVAVFVVNV